MYYTLASVYNQPSLRGDKSRKTTLGFNCLVFIPFSRGRFPLRVASLKGNDSSFASRGQTPPEGSARQRPGNFVDKPRPGSKQDKGRSTVLWKRFQTRPEKALYSE